MNDQDERPQLTATEKQMIRAATLELIIELATKLNAPWDHARDYIAPVAHEIAATAQEVRQ